MKGIVLAGGRATRLSPASRATSKQLMHVYDKPLVYYPVSTLLHARINEILIISTPDQLPMFEALLGDGSQWGCSFSYAAQPEPNGIAAAFLIGADFIGDDDVALILGDNIFYGWHLGEQLQEYTKPKGAVVFGLWVPDPERYGVLEMGPGGEVVAIHEKPLVAPSNYMIPGLYFYDNSVVEVARSIEPSPRGELEISEVNSQFLKRDRLEVCRLPFATEWFDVGTFDALLDAQTWVGGQQHRKGLLIGAPETAAYREGFIDADQLRALAAASDQGEDLMKSGYGELLLRFLEFADGRAHVSVEISDFAAAPSAIEGLHVISMKQVTDERGTVREFYRESAFVDAGLGSLGAFLQVNATETKQGGVRGMHAERITKLVAVVAGEAFGAWVDLRADSPTRGAVVTLPLTPGVQVLVPKGVGNGFQAVAPGVTQYVYCFDQEWVPGMPGLACTPLDPALGIDWPLPIDVDDRTQISQKDLDAPLFADLGARS